MELLGSLYNKYMQETTIFTTIKNLLYFPAILLGLSLDSYLILVVFMSIDIVLGITRTYVIYGGKYIKSYRFAVGVLSKLLMLIVPLLLVWTGKGVGINILFIAQWSLGALILSEAYSILGNIHSIRVKKDLPEFDAMSWVLQRIQLFLIHILQNSATQEKGDLSPSFKDKHDEK